MDIDDEAVPKIRKWSSQRKCGSRYYLILAKDLEYGDVSGSSQLLEEVGKLLKTYSQAILNSSL